MARQLLFHNFFEGNPFPDPKYPQVLANLNTDLQKTRPAVGEAAGVLFSDLPSHCFETLQKKGTLLNPPVQEGGALLGEQKSRGRHTKGQWETDGEKGSNSDEGATHAGRVRWVPVLLSTKLKKG